MITNKLPAADKLPQEAPDYDLKDLLEAGVHFGHRSSKWNPKMEEWIYMDKEGVHIFDLAKTKQQLQLAYNTVYYLGANNKKLVFVGTKRQAGECIADLIEDRPWLLTITSRWLGGFLTNWSQVSKSLNKMVDMEKGLEEGKYAERTKYEIVQIEKEINRLKRFFGGIESLKDKPDALFIIDPNKEAITVKEANMEGVPVIALTDSNTDPDGIDLVIPGNDDARKSIEFITTQMVAAYEAGRNARK